MIPKGGFGGDSGSPFSLFRKATELFEKHDRGKSVKTASAQPIQKEQPHREEVAPGVYLNVLGLTESGRVVESERIYDFDVFDSWDVDGKRLVLSDKDTEDTIIPTGTREMSAILASRFGTELMPLIMDAILKHGPTALDRLTAVEYLRDWGENEWADYLLNEVNDAEWLEIVSNVVDMAPDDFIDKASSKKRADFESEIGDPGYEDETPAYFPPELMKLWLQLKADGTVDEDTDIDEFAFALQDIGEDEWVDYAYSLSRAEYQNMVQNAIRKGASKRADLDIWEGEPEEEEKESDQPQPQDIVMTPSGSLGGKTSVSEVEGKFLGEFDTEEEAEAFIKQYMKEQNWYPTVWWLSDHGNLSIRTLGSKQADYEWYSPEMQFARQQLLEQAIEVAKQHGWSAKVLLRGTNDQKVRFESPTGQSFDVWYPVEGRANESDMGDLREAIDVIEQGKFGSKHAAKGWYGDKSEEIPNAWLRGRVQAIQIADPSVAYPDAVLQATREWFEQGKWAEEFKRQQGGPFGYRDTGMGYDAPVQIDPGAESHLAADRNLGPEEDEAYRLGYEYGSQPGAVELNTQEISERLSWDVLDSKPNAEGLFNAIVNVTEFQKGMRDALKGNSSKIDKMTGQSDLFREGKRAEYQVHDLEPGTVMDVPGSSFAPGEFNPNFIVVGDSGEKYLIPGSFEDEDTGIYGANRYFMGERVMVTWVATADQILHGIKKNASVRPKEKGSKKADLDTWEGEPEEEDQPQPEDITMTPSGPLGSRISVGEVEGKFLGEFDTEEEAEAFIKQYMEQNQFWPSVWYVSDHGNWHLRTLASKTADFDDFTTPSDEQNTKLKKFFESGDPDLNPTRGYDQMIIQNTGCSPDEVGPIEWLMRTEKPTLDALSEEDFADLARDAYASYKYVMKAGSKKQAAASNEEIAKAFHGFLYSERGSHVGSPMAAMKLFIQYNYPGKEGEFEQIYQAFLDYKDPSSESYPESLYPSD